eukprot:Clim_evm27s231 gene=Clim_evmTU27s231
MGNDGGTVPRRDAMVRTKEVNQTLDKAQQRSSLWDFCRLSSEPLRPPLCTDRQGRLMNYEAAVEGIIRKLPVLGPVRGLRDLIVIKTEKTINNSNSTNEVRILCPVSGLEMNGRYGFCVSSPCGCLYATRVLENASAVGSTKTVRHQPNKAVGGDVTTMSVIEAFERSQHECLICSQQLSSSIDPELIGIVPLNLQSRGAVEWLETREVRDRQRRDSLRKIARRVKKRERKRLELEEEEHNVVGKKKPRT